MKAPTIHDLAADLNISATTVWRALQGRGRISEKTRERVLARAKALNFVPSLVAQNLSHGRTNTLGVIVPIIGHPVFSALIEEIEAVAFARGYNIMLCDARLDLAREAEYARMLQRRRVEGVVVIPFSNATRQEDAHLVELQKRNVPVVLLEHELPTNRFAKVVADNFAATRDMTRHLIKLGHKRIAFAFHPFQERDLVGRERLSGFTKAMADAGLARRATLLLDACAFGSEQELHYFPEKIADCFRRKDRPTALFCGMDALAIRALETLRELGLRVPEDVAVAGFDNVEFSEFTTPPLTTVQQPLAEMGRLAAEMLFDRLEGKTTRAVCKRLPCRLVIRKSCGAARSNP
ncbi:MAG TPA: LacI family DNA-binding transcriptional regulator [Candidatus Methylacidiphilales bacterium]|jgi:DNA-binding LacI/PurR family transcriptional regulator|nr:LacI family DNA-binding transcriptional regulator [Candidatus Methylacidiphilales bacterium]